MPLNLTRTKHARLCSVQGEKMKITSPAFENNGNIPDEYTCKGKDISPEVRFENVPTGTESLVLIMDDPDAPGQVWDHWILFNIPSSIIQIPENTQPGASGKNSWGRTRYGGPCPPSGEHRYRLKLYALDKRLELQEGASKQEVQEAMQGHILEEAQLTGKYSKQNKQSPEDS